MWLRNNKIYLIPFPKALQHSNDLPHPPLIGSQFSMFSHLNSVSNRWHPSLSPENNVSSKRHWSTNLRLSPQAIMHVFHQLPVSIKGIQFLLFTLFSVSVFHLFKQRRVNEKNARATLKQQTTPPVCLAVFVGMTLLDNFQSLT